MEAVRSESLTPGRSYALSNALERGRKAFLQVKLTDSFITSLEQFQAAEPRDKRLRVSFASESSGVIDVNTGHHDGLKQYVFTLSSLDQQGSIECVLDRRDRKELSVLGNVSHKMMILGRADSYEKTKKTMVEAKNEKEKTKAQEIKLGPKRGALKPRGPRAVLLKRRPMVISSVSTPPSMKSNKSLRNRVVHVLALKPQNRLELSAKLGKDGKGTGLNLQSTLFQVADFKDNKFHLKKHLYSELQIDKWPLYTEEERALLRKKITDEKSPVNSKRDSSSLQPRQETLASSTGLKFSKTSPFKAVATRKHRKSEEEREANVQQKITHASGQCTTLPVSTFHVPVRKRGMSCVSNSPFTSCVKKVKVNGLESSLTSNTSSNSLHSTETEKMKCQTDQVPHTHKGNEKESGGQQALHSQEDMSNERLSLDYQSKYTRITSAEMRTRYKNDFNAEYPKYQQLQQELDPFQNRAKKLAEQWKSLDPDSAKYLKVEKKIEREWEKWENDKHLQKVQRERDALYDKLSYIKQLVVQFDNEQTEPLQTEALQTQTD